MDACILTGRDAAGQGNISENSRVAREQPVNTENATTFQNKVNLLNADGARSAFEIQHAPQLAKQRAEREALERDPTSFYATRTNEDDMRRFLGHLFEPGSTDAVEVRVLNALRGRDGAIEPPKPKDSKVGRGAIWSGLYTRPEAIINRMFGIRGVSVYVCLGPVDLGLLEADRGRTLQVVKPNEMHILSKGTGVTHRAVRVFRWLFVDIDPRRPPTPADDPERKFNATGDEQAETIRVRDEILDLHPALKGSAIWGTSGNGSWILVRLPDLPNDSARRDAVGNVRPGPNAALIASSLALIARRHGRPGADIDQSVKVLGYRAFDRLPVAFETAARVKLPSWMASRPPMRNSSS